MTGPLEPQAEAMAAAAAVAAVNPQRRVVPPTVTRVLYGDFLTGEIAGELDALSCSWEQTLNDAGSISSVQVPESEVRRLQLRNETQSWRTFLAIEQNGRIREAGPIVTRPWDWEKGVLTLGARGFWYWLDKRVFQRPGFPVLTIANRSLGGIARSVIFNATSGVPYSNPPLVLPDIETGTHTETFPLWNLPRVGEQLRQITKRAVGAPDIRFRPRRQPGDPTRIEWVVEIGTADAPELAQVGDDWIFDATVPQGPVRGISTDEDASEQAEQAWVTGNGMEEDMLLASAARSELLDQGWPLTEVIESRPTVEDQFTLEEHAEALVDRSARPIEVFKVTVSANAATEVLAGHYCRLATKGDAWIPDGERRMRIAKISGSLADVVVLDMYPLQAML